MKPNIRLATEVDAHEIANVHIVSWQAVYHGYMTDNILNNLSIQKRTQE